jgi:hypothetical protein
MRRSSALDMLDPRHRVWRSYGLRRTRKTFEALVIGRHTIPEIADYVGLTHRTVNDHLTALVLYGMAEEQPDCESWIACVRTPEE